MSYTVTKHARERWQQRVNPKAGEDTEQQLLQALENAEYIADEAETNCSYYMNSDHWLFVVDTTKKTIVTVIEIDYGFSPDINKALADKLLDEVRTAKTDLESSKAKCDDAVNTVLLASDAIENQIEQLEAELQKLNARRTELKADCTIKQKEFEKLLKQLVYSVSYRTEMLILNKKVAQ